VVVLRDTLLLVLGRSGGACGLARREAEKARTELNKVRVTYGHLRDVVSIAMTAWLLEPILLHDQLRTLLGRVCAAVTAGLHQGVTYDLAAANSRT
jgi:hypothetical protein